MRCSRRAYRQGCSNGGNSLILLVCNSVDNLDWPRANVLFGANYFVEGGAGSCVDRFTEPPLNLHE